MTQTSTNEIESVRPILTVIDDEGDLIINSIGPRGKAMVQAVLVLANSARKISVISDGEMKVMKRSGAGQPTAVAVTGGAVQATENSLSTYAAVKARHDAAIDTGVNSPPSPAPPDIQDQFAADLAAGRTGESAMGETPSPTPGPNDPVAIPAPRRRPRQIFQDAAAPPAPELAQAEMDQLLAEAAQAEQDAAKVAEDQRFQRQQAIQSNEPVEDVPPAAEQPRRRQRNLVVAGSPCSRCGGSGIAYRVDGDGGAVVDGEGHPITGTCNVCAGSGQVKKFGRGR